MINVNLLKEDAKLTELVHPEMMLTEEPLYGNYDGSSFTTYKSFLREDDLLTLQLTTSLGYELLAEANSQEEQADAVLVGWSPSGPRPSEEASDDEVSHEPCLPYEIDSTEDIPEPIPLVRQVDSKAPILTRGGLSLILGYAKSRKTFLVSALAAVALGKQNLGLEANERGYKVAVCDTEEGRYFASKVKKRIQRLMGWSTKQNQKRFKYFEIRNMGVEERLQAIEEIARDFQPDILFIDGILDCCLDYNSSKEADNTVNVLLRLSAEYDMHICTVLHTNKDKTTAKGHLGSIVLAKVETGLEVTYQRDKSEVKPAANSCRHIPFTPFSFGIDAHGLPYLCGDVPLSQDELFMEVVKGDIIALFHNSKKPTQKWSDIMKVLMKNDRLSEYKARKLITTLLKEGFIIKADDATKGYSLSKAPA